MDGIWSANPLLGNSANNVAVYLEINVKSMKIKLAFSYYNEEYTIDISNNENILSLIEK